MTSRLGDMLRDLRDPGLSRTRLDEIVREANEFSDRAAKVQAWSRFTDNNPYFETARAFRGDFNISPINGYSFVNNAAQSIPNATWTKLTFNNYTEPSPIITPTDENGKFKITPQHSLFGVIGAAQWAVGAGIRSMMIYVYDIDDILLYSQELQQVPANGVAGNDILPFANVAWIQPFKNITYFRFYAWQNSGGALNMAYVRIGVFAFF